MVKISHTNSSTKHPNEAMQIHVPFSLPVSSLTLSLALPTEGLKSLSFDTLALKYSI